MSTFESLSHSRWDCKYHVVFVSNSHFGGILPGLRFGRRVRETAQHENEQRVPTIEA
jgi:REP element-mobilizing transposase RayT